MVQRMDKEYIDKNEAYRLIKHEAETHELPASKEAYKRAARIVAQMCPRICTANGGLPPAAKRGLYYANASLAA